jgi:hypothetical protein
VIERLVAVRQPVGVSPGELGVPQLLLPGDDFELLAALFEAVDRPRSPEQVFGRLPRPTAQVQDAFGRSDVETLDGLPL